jgi:hypothetical protein
VRGASHFPKQDWSFAMAKRTRASARGEPASKTATGYKKKRARENNSKSAHNAVQQRTAPKIATQISRTANALKARRIVFTPEALSHARYRYEHTDASLADIAVDLRVARGTVRNLARSNGWVHYVRPPRGLSPAVQLNAQASELEAQGVGASVPVTPFSENADTVQQGEGTSQDGASTVMPQLTDTVARLYRAVMDELVAVETLRAQLKREPKSPQDAERTARTLSSLTETIQKLRRLQCAVPQSGPHDDDIPADIDEFRTELARRIEAFVASRSDQGAGGGPDAASVDTAAG